MTNSEAPNYAFFSSPLSLRLWSIRACWTWGLSPRSSRRTMNQVSKPQTLETFLSSEEVCLYLWVSECERNTFLGTRSDVTNNRNSKEEHGLSKCQMWSYFLTLGLTDICISFLHEWHQTVDSLLLVAEILVGAHADTLVGSRVTSFWM
jgi:hypothetical protein